MKTSHKIAGALLVAGALAVGIVARLAVQTGNGETRYQRPGPHAGALAQSWWTFYWEGTEFTDAEGKWHSNRCYFLPAGRIAPPPPSSVSPCVNPIPAVPRSNPASGVFDPASFPCPTDPTKLCFRQQDGATVPVSEGAAGRTTGLGPSHGVGIIGEDGKLYGLVDQAPIQPPTPGPSPTKTPSPAPSAPPSPTPPPGGLICWTVTPQRVCVTPTRTP